MAAIKKSTNKRWRGFEKRDPSYTVDGNATGTATTENNVEIP